MIHAAGIPLPVPGSVLLVDAGEHHRASLPTSLFVLAATALATLLGALALYALARRAGPTLIDKYGKYFGLKPSRVDRMQTWFDRHGELALVLGRVIPGMSVPTVVIAGTVGVLRTRYAISTFFGALAWAALYYYLGSVVDAAIAHIIAWLAGTLDMIPGWIMIIGVVLLLIVGTEEAWRRRHRASVESPRPS